MDEQGAVSWVCLAAGGRCHVAARFGSGSGMGAPTLACGGAAPCSLLKLCRHCVPVPRGSKR